MYQKFQQRLKLLDAPDVEEALASSKIGLEKESLRVLPEGGISQTPHPAALGSPLRNPQITTDFSEALVELVT
ncbi:MAG: glutamate--cysteine ligase, partial [Gammaproteobacteria bacterium]